VHHDEDVSQCRSESCACRRSPLLRCRRGRSQAGRLTAPEVADIVSGGHWSADGKGGFYRALVVMAGDKAAIANVYLQWLSFGDAAKPTVVKSVPVKEINDQNLGNASIEIGGEEDQANEATIFVSSYDVEEDKDICFSLRRPNPALTRSRGPPEGPEQGSGEGAPKGTPQAGAPSEGKAPAKGEKPGVED